VVFTNLDENNSRPEDIAARVAAIYIPDLARGGQASK
jgi:hypothetical protein